jgi:hypothetical protein
MNLSQASKELWEMMVKTALQSWSALQDWWQRFSKVFSVKEALHAPFVLPRRQTPLQLLPTELQRLFFLPFA